jgi:hypothetical protein
VAISSILGILRQTMSIAFGFVGMPAFRIDSEAPPGLLFLEPAFYLKL